VYIIVSNNFTVATDILYHTTHFQKRDKTDSKLHNHKAKISL